MVDFLNNFAIIVGGARNSSRRKSAPDRWRIFCTRFMAGAQVIQHPKGEYLRLSLRGSSSRCQDGLEAVLVAIINAYQGGYMSKIINFPNREQTRQRLLLRDPIHSLEADIFYLCMSLEKAMLKLSAVRDNLKTLDEAYHDNK